MKRLKHSIFGLTVIFSGVAIILFAGIMKMPYVQYFGVFVVVMGINLSLLSIADKV